MTPRSAGRNHRPASWPIPPDRAAKGGAFVMKTSRRAGRWWFVVAIVAGCLAADRPAKLDPRVVKLFGGETNLADLEIRKGRGVSRWPASSRRECNRREFGRAECRGRLQCRGTDNESAVPARRQHWTLENHVGADCGRRQECRRTGSDLHRSRDVPLGYRQEMRVRPRRGPAVCWRKGRLTCCSVSRATNWACTSTANRSVSKTPITLGPGWLLSSNGFYQTTRRFRRSTRRDSGHLLAVVRP